jgi:2-keto-4-pentenoate hydratase/2-oxohepta-3-ene-1,7-dioic acid hydratase in catechol pathway
VKLVTYEAGEGPRAGVVVESGIIDAWRVLGEPLRGSLRELIAEGRIDETRTKVFDPGGTVVEPVPHEEAKLLPPIPDPEKIVCLALNYRAHAEEAGREVGEIPSFFAKYRNALAPPGATVRLPAASSKVDYEAEVAFVIGRRATEVNHGQALGHVAGYTLLNDLSARDLQFATSQFGPGKVFDGSAPCGPWLVTPDEAGPPDGIGIALDLNGERMQEATTADLIFGVGELVTQLSRLMTLEPGDIVSTGTPAGVGGAREPRVWLADDDEIVVSSPTLGELRTSVARG